MNPTSLEFGIAILMVAVGIALIIGFSRHIAAASGRRMAEMMMCAGVDPEVSRKDDAQAIIQDARSRCIRCPSEGLCERWLAGKVEGNPGFCPNARLFRMLSGTTGPIGP